MVSKLSAFWKARKAPAYTRMSTQDHDERPRTNRSSFEESLHRFDQRRFTPWPNFSVEDGFKPQTDDTISTAGLFYPTRSPTQSNPGFFRKCKLMCTKFPVRDMSYLVGVSFTIGSAVFVVNGFFLLLPLIAPSTNFSTETPYATPASSVIGTLIFLVGSWVAVLEALNLDRGEPIVTEGIPLESSTESIFKKGDEESIQIKIRDHSTDSSSSQASETSIKKPTPQFQSSNTLSSNIQSNIPVSPAPQPAMLGSPTFIYFPSTYQLTNTYLRSIIFHASVIQLIGAIIFAFATITSIPNVVDLTNTTLLHYLNLLPATLGGVLFLVAALLQILNSHTLLSQPWTFWRKWDWWVGLWNAIGSLGFLLAGLLPWVANGAAWGTLQGTLADFWGSWAFLIGSLVQWWGVMGGYS
ncbi:uncharacterized protein PAC_12796 [Phialocephala subalpina]|uniref:Integral membrane protein n=1 Tax=Phialocephala subalpina TaxID=576137 RepID=A0A1L7XCY6_9HELO|nr:uncharacterized protein PAC_12796 [Phialocephala subalpina]